MSEKEEIIFYGKRTIDFDRLYVLHEAHFFNKKDALKFARDLDERENLLEALKKTVKIFGHKDCPYTKEFQKIINQAESR